MHGKLGKGIIRILNDFFSMIEKNIYFQMIERFSSKISQKHIYITLLKNRIRYISYLF